MVGCCVLWDDMKRGMHILTGGAVLAILFVPIGLGFFLSWVDFTYGSQGLDDDGPGKAYAMAAAWLAGGILFEWIFRARMLGALRRRMRLPVAFAVHLGLIALLLLLPFLRVLGGDYGGMSGMPLLLYEVLLQALWAALYLRTGSFITAGIAHGIFNAVRFELMGDITGAHETLYFYTASHPGFSALVFAAPLCGLAMVSAWRRQKP